MKKPRGRNWEIKIIVVTFLLGVLFFLSVFVAAHGLKLQAMSDSESTMQKSAYGIAFQMRTSIENNIKVCEAVASVIKNMPEFDADYAKNVIDGMALGDNSVRLEMLMRDNMLASSGGGVIPAPEWLDFAAEVQKGAYVSSLETDSFLPSKQVVKVAVPVTFDGVTEAVVYSVVDVSSFANTYKTDIYSANTGITLAEGVSGQYLSDTWFGTSGNIRDSGLSDSKYSDGTDVFEEFASGETGYIIYCSKITGTWRAGCYIPVGVNDWMLMLSVPETDIEDSVMPQLRILYILSAAIAFMLILYFVWMLRRYKNSFTNMTNTYGISHILLDSHEDESKFGEALGYIAEVFKAEETFFIAIGDNGEAKKYYSGGRGARFDAPTLVRLLEKVCESGSVIRRELIEISAADGHTCVIKNYMASPVRSGSGKLIGIIGVINMKKKQETTTVLDNLALTFAMALHNFDAYTKLTRLSTIDSVTGLLNRHMFKDAMETFSLEQPSEFSCVYMDVNGLHALNNNEGHEAGDALLRHVAAVLQNVFGEDCTYRIGGDEFVVFKTGTKPDVMEHKIGRMKEQIEEKDYHVSIGWRYEEKLTDIKETLNGAEHEMQRDKYRFYQRMAEARESTAHEKTSLADAAPNEREVFLRAAMPRFKGAYIVNLKTEEARAIYESEPFEGLLRRSNGKFISALKLYVKEHVDSDYQREFAMFFDRGWLIEQLNADEDARLLYTTENGRETSLNVVKSENYTPDYPETVWIAEHNDK